MTCVELKSYIYNRNYITNVLESLGCTKIKVWDNRISCCNPDGDNPTACVVYKNENLNVSNYTRDLEKLNKNPDIITLVQYYKNSDFRKAILWLHKLFNLNPAYSAIEKNVEETALEKYYRLVHPSMLRKSGKKINLNKNKTIDESELYGYSIYPHKDFVIDGCISQKTITKFELGYSDKHQRTTMPVRHWAGGALVGVRGRTSIPMASEIGVAKYFPLAPFSTGCELYGLYENYDNISKSKTLILFEGEKSVLKLDSLYKRFEKFVDDPCYGVAVFGHNISDEQAEIIKHMGIKKVVVAFDKDVNRDKVIRVSRKMIPFVPELYYIEDTESLLGEKESPIDPGIETFAYLYNNKKLVRETIIS